MTRVETRPPEASTLRWCRPCEDGLAVPTCEIAAGFRPRLSCRRRKTWMRGSNPGSSPGPRMTRRRLFDHLVGAAEERDRDRDAERPRGPQIDGQLDPAGLLHR